MALIYFFRNFPTLIQQSDGAIRIHFNIPIHTQVFHRHADAGFGIRKLIGDIDGTDMAAALF